MFRSSHSRPRHLLYISSINPGPLIRCTSIAAPITSWLSSFALFIGVFMHITLYKKVAYPYFEHGLQDQTEIKTRALVSDLFKLVRNDSSSPRPRYEAAPAPIFALAKVFVIFAAFCKNDSALLITNQPDPQIIAAPGSTALPRFAATNRHPQNPSTFPQIREICAICG